MLLQEIKEIPTDIKTLRKFGTTMGIFFVLVAAFVFWRKKEEAVIYTFAALSVFFLFFAAVVPAWLKPIQKVWMTLALLMGWVMTRVLLAVLFYGILTPIAAITRIMKKNFLDLKVEKKAPTYWKTHPARTRETYEQQF
jgi:polyferredoxin